MNKIVIPALFLAFAATGLYAQNAAPAIDPGLLYGKGLDIYNKGGPLTAGDTREFYREGGSQAVRQTPAADFNNAARRGGDSQQAQALADLRYLLNRGNAPAGAKLPEMPKLAPAPFASPIPSQTRPADITQSANPLDMLTAQDQTLNPAFRYPGSPSMKSPGVGSYNFFSGSGAGGGGGSGAGGGGSSRFGLGASRTPVRGAARSPGAGVSPQLRPRPGASPGGSPSTTRSARSILSADRAPSASPGAAGASKK